MSESLIELELDGPVATIRINRPQSLNAMNVAAMDAMFEVLDRVEASPARVLVVTGRGRAFSSGVDLNGDDLTPGRGDAGRILETHLNPLFERLNTFPLPVVTAVNGLAAGAGCSLALSGDIVIAARSAYFLQAFINIGLVPDVGATWLLPRLVGRARAMAMMMLGDRLAADQALEWGLIYQVVDDVDLEGAARAVADRLASGPTRAYVLLREGVRVCLDGTLADALAMERRHQRTLGLSADFVEGVAAFSEKRAPAFVGR